MSPISYIVGFSVSLGGYTTCTQTRSLFGIVLGCITTLFASTWTAIHPNIPGPNESKLAVALRRSRIMLLALVAPECIVVWAFHQLIDSYTTYRDFNKALQEGTIGIRVKYGSEPWLVCCDAPLEADEKKMDVDDKHSGSWYKSFFKSVYYSITSMLPGAFFHKRAVPPSDPEPVCRRWTMKHSFFVWMGGFMLFVNKGPYMREIYAPLTPHELLEFIKADSIRAPIISEKEIDDRSKGDWVSKTVAFLQLSWFILQLTARAVRRLPTTQLEVDTLAICILSCFTYLAWWYKPKDIQCAVSVYWKGSSSPGKMIYSHSKTSAQLVAACWDNPRDISRFTLKVLSVTQPFIECFGLWTTKACVKEHRVPTLGGYLPGVTLTDDGRLTWDCKRIVIISVPGGASALVFIGVHFTAWDSFFPSHVERLLWRVATAGMLVAISLAGPLFVCGILLSLKRMGKVTDQVVWTMRTGVILGVIPYIIFRLFIVVLMLLRLRSVDPGVHETICWTSMIPHL